jgi:hypothetical protein
LRCDSARAAQNPARPIGVLQYSAPPATITSASPCWIILAASPMLWVPVVQAVTIAKFAPRGR